MDSSTFKYMTVFLSLLIIPCSGDNMYCEDNTKPQGSSLLPELVDASNMDELYYANDNIDLYCCFQGQLTVATTWFKNNESLVLGSKYKFSENNQVLSIPKSTTKDSGKYRCQGDNKHGTYVWDIAVKVLSPICKKTPMIHSLNPVVKANKGASVQLECTIALDKSCILLYPRFSWRGPRRAGQLQNGGSQVGEMKLTIKNVEEYHAGNYRCIVRDYYGHKMSQVLLEVS